MRRHLGLISGAHFERRDHVLEARRSAAVGHALAQSGIAAFEKLAVPRQAPHLGAAPESQHLPPEHRAVEGLRPRRVAGAQAIEVQRARLVDDARALVLPRLPYAELGPLRIGQHGHAAGARDIERLKHHAPARFQRLRRGLVGAVDPDVGVPSRRRRSALRRRADGGNIAAVEARDEVLAGRARRHHVLEIPSEEAPVEGDRGLRIGLARIDPAWNAGHVSVSLEHWCSLLAG